MSTIHLLGGDLGDIINRNERIDSITPQVLQEVFKKDFPFDRYTVVTLDAGNGAVVVWIPNRWNVIGALVACSPPRIDEVSRGNPSFLSWLATVRAL